MSWQIRFMTLFIGLSCSHVFAQEEAIADNQIKLYLDCHYCDLTLLRSKIDYINYMRDREMANIHLMVNRVRSGANGYRHTFKFMGKGMFAEQNYQLTLDEQPNMARRERHERIGELIETGLIPYWM
ncbi:MAG: hypothetical protein OEQ53_15575, partial [Saprospiraceae bacterium]|nr:hypothetical protein [Saprospiraceae bacterium]